MPFPASRTIPLHAVFLSSVCEGRVPDPGGTYTGSWLHAVVDDDGNLVLSTEHRIKPLDDQDLYLVKMAEAEVIDPTMATWSSLSWTALGLISTSLPDTPTIRCSVSDHWHVFAGGTHWLSFNGTPSASIGLVSVSMNLLTVSTPITVATALDDKISTNDHFLVAADGDLAVGARYGKTSALKIFPVDYSGSVGTVVEFAGPASRSACSANAGGSAVGDPQTKTKMGYHGFWPFLSKSHTFDYVDVLVPSEIGIAPPSEVNVLRTLPPAWRTPLGARATIPTPADPNRSIGFPTAVVLSNGWRVVTYRSVDVTMGDDNRGSMCPQTYDDDWNVWGHETVLFDAESTTNAGLYGAQRPHMCLYGDYLITTWDVWDIANTRGYGLYMRVDSITIR